MHTYTAEQVLAAEPARVSTAVDEVVRRIWGEYASLVATDGPLHRTYALSTSDTDGSADVWLTFRLVPADRSTQVQVVLDELDRGPDPGDALAEVLAALAATVPDERSPKAS